MEDERLKDGRFPYSQKNKAKYTQAHRQIYKCSDSFFTLHIRILCGGEGGRRGGSTGRRGGILGRRGGSVREAWWHIRKAWWLKREAWWLNREAWWLNREEWWLSKGGVVAN